MIIFTCIASHTHAVCPLFLFWSSPPATSLTLSMLLPCLTTQLPCTDGARHSPSASSRPLPSAWLLSSFTTLLLDVSRPAFPIPLGFPSPNCTSRPHSRERSHAPWQGYSLPVRLEKVCWDCGRHGLLSYGLTLIPSVTYPIWRSWVGKSQQLWLGWSSRYLAGTNPTTTGAVSTF